MAAPHTKQIKDVNARYHDLAAEDYDSRWSIDFGSIGQDQVKNKLEKALGTEHLRFKHALEIGAGTGYFSLNLRQAGLVDRVTATDISQGMLDRLSATANELEVGVECVRCDAEQLPFADEEFDLVLGHAILHHLPNLTSAFTEFHRVLQPGGRLAFCGEPSLYGDRIATLPKRTGSLLAPLWRGALRIDAAKHDGAATDGLRPEKERLEPYVDVHAFTPAALQELAGGAGFEAVQVRGEELLANTYGWILRTLEGSADREDVPYAWNLFACRTYLALQKLDRRLLEPRLPAAIFYNLLLSARKPR